MKTDRQKPGTRARPSARARAEAAAWIARLHGPNRTAEAEAGFHRWLSEDPERAAAFELLTDTWEKSARLRRRPFERRAPEAAGFRISVPRAVFAAVAVAILAVVGTFFFLRDDAITTGVGEQRTVLLEDGSRVYMNTDTRIVPRFDGATRRMELAKGEALFEVAKDPRRPFIVTVGDRQVRALGTSFVVRRDTDNVEITLVEGKVAVLPARNSEAPGAAVSFAANFSSPTPYSSSVVLRPGQRLTIAQSTATAERSEPKVDSPPIENVTAWQRGQVALDDMSLADAVAEMNRYSRLQIVIEDPNTAAIRVSGIFRAGDQENFAEAVARTYQLSKRTEEHEIVLGAHLSK
jgi:transmembrane sensor